MQDYAEDKEELELQRRILENTLDGHPYWTLDGWINTIRPGILECFSRELITEISNDMIDLDNISETERFYPFS